MKKEVKTPLGVVYIDDEMCLSMSENLDLCRVSQVWGVYLYAEVGKINIFVSKNNGADMSLTEARALSENLCESSFFNEKYDNTLCACLPHYEEFLLLNMSYIEDINKTMDVFRQNGIAADNLFDDEYLVFSDDVFKEISDLNEYRLKTRFFDDYRLFKTMRTDDGCENVRSFGPEDDSKYQRFHTRVFLHHKLF